MGGGAPRQVPTRQASACTLTISSHPLRNGKGGGATEETAAAFRAVLCSRLRRVRHGFRDGGSSKSGGGIGPDGPRPRQARDALSRSSVDAAPGNPEHCRESKGANTELRCGGGAPHESGRGPARRVVPDDVRKSLHKQLGRMYSRTPGLRACPVNQQAAIHGISGPSLHLSARSSTNLHAGPAVCESCASDSRFMAGS